MLRVFRVLKLAHYMSEANLLMAALRASRRKISVFLWAVLTMVVVLGALMYLIEKPHNDHFTSIPRSIYWAIVTLTTVGYGDITPVTGIGQALAAVIMILGYGIIAVPTGIVTSEIAMQQNKLAEEGRKICPGCHSDHHRPEAVYCYRCGANL